MNLREKSLRKSDSGFGFMPRRWFTAILFVLALAVQACLPVANGVAAARGADIHGLSEICLKAGGSDHGGHHAPGHVHGRHDCALCQAFCDGVAPVAARPFSVGMAPAQWKDVPWAVADRALPAPPRDYGRQARAPPSFS
ncbi:DUF2946 family protein [Methylocystis sp. S23]|jgi:hypothetical protein